MWLVILLDWTNILHKTRNLIKRTVCYFWRGATAFIHVGEVIEFYWVKPSILKVIPSIGYSIKPEKFENTSCLLHCHCKTHKLRVIFWISRIYHHSSDLERTNQYRRWSVCVCFYNKSLTRPAKSMLSCENLIGLTWPFLVRFFVPILLPSKRLAFYIHNLEF